ncbi:peptidoglycan DD-metalloendopeptidase family protein [Rossellomorea sp. RS05]|uniref:peptidoglycan DD-metalloendopeptidase family protein n=1 Tax=Rossellomorea sp. RS05 TaxID=3149166 RepID=UPI003221BF04
MFNYPVEDAKLTSPFGRDVLNGRVRSHFGIDLAKSGAVNVKAAAAGVVSQSYRSDSYGEVVFVVHNLGGKTYETVYAHMRAGSRKVNVGASVKQGQVLGLMGNTGYSYGQHLHFELHAGRWNETKSNAVDPLKYLDKVAPASNASSHTIKSGDTLWDIAKAYGTSVKDLERLNPSVDAKALKIGAKLNVAKKADSYSGKKLVCKVAKLKFYSKPSWQQKDVAGHLTKGIGFPTVVRKLKVDDAYQYEIKNSKGATFYVTANGAYVDVK